MQYDDSTNGQGLLQDITFLTGADTNAFPESDRVRSINSWYYTAVSWIWQATGTWEYDDSNHTDLPIATTTLVDSQGDYALPSTAQKLLRVAILDANGKYQTVEQIDRTDFPRNELETLYETDGFPQFYDVVGNSVILLPAPAAAAVTVAAGLKVFFSRDINEFTAADTTQEPGFKPDSCHRILSVGASLDWAMKTGRESAVVNNLNAMLGSLRQELQEFHGSRNRDARTVLKPKTARKI